MKILIWHGYLLGGTGSNVYTRQLAREWSRAGHDVTVLCQEPQPELHDVGTAEVVRPDVGGLLPVFVLVLGAGGWLMDQRLLEVWLFLNVVVAFLHYAYDGLIWRHRSAS